MNKPHIVLLGFMGVGKSTIGQELAKLSGYSFIDTDHQIEENTGRSISDIFNQQGESHFRELEHSLAKTLIKSPPSIVSTGGGFCLNPKIAQLLSKTEFWCVYLTLNFEDIWKRIQQSSRPLVKTLGKEGLLTLLATRSQQYSAISNYICKTDDLPPLAISQTIWKNYKL